MTIAVGIKKLLTYKREITFGVIPVAASGQALRRVTSSLDLTKNAFKSAEIRPDQQQGDFRHGGRMVAGTINGELSVGTHQDFLSSVLRQAWQIVSTTGLQITIASASTTGAAGTYTRSAGSFLTDGFKVGDVVRAIGWTAPATANNAHNFWITALTATVMTGQHLDGVAMVTKVAGDSVTLAQAGKKTFTPALGQTNDSYSIEHWFSDIGQSEVFSGCRVSQVDVKMPATGMAAIDIAIMGQNMLPAQAQYFTSPTVVTPGSTLTGVNGALSLNGTVLGIVTGLNFSIKGGATRGDVVGSVLTPDIFMGGLDVDGTATIYFQDNIARDLFLAETEMALSVVLTANNTPNADFQAYTMPRVKLNSATKNDGEIGLVLTVAFIALYNTTGSATSAAGLQTTLSVQDSLVP